MIGIMEFKVIVSIRFEMEMEMEMEMETCDHVLAQSERAQKSS